MNINEVEEQSGLNRANIRYYEKEGLIAPERKENGYRDYTEENLKELRKIRLFRELELPIEKIKELQNSPDTLEHIMQQHILNIEQQANNLENVITICKDIQNTGLSYIAINAEQYLDKNQDFEKLNSSESNSQNTHEKSTPSYQYTDVEKENPHTYIRFAAHAIDFLICELLVMFVWKILLHQISADTLKEMLLITLFCILLTLFLDPLCISLFRTTPGKKIFGITLSNFDGTALTYNEAFWRTKEVILCWLGLSRPGYSNYQGKELYKRRVKKTGNEWDLPEVIDYQIPDRSFIFPALQAVIYIVICIILILEMQIFELRPPNKGNLTLEEYVENYNYYVDYYAAVLSDNYYTYEGFYLNKDGQFDPQSSHSEGIFEDPIITFNYTFDGDYITEVSFEFEKNFIGPVTFDGFFEEMIYASLAFTAAQEKYHVPTFKILELTQFFNWFNLAFQDYNVTFGDVNISCDLDYDEALFEPQPYFKIVFEGSKAWYDIHFKISK